MIIRGISNYKVDNSYYLGPLLDKTPGEIYDEFILGVVNDHPWHLTQRSNATLSIAGFDQTKFISLV